MPAAPSPSAPPAGTYWELEAELDSASEELWTLHCFQQGATGAEWREEGIERLRIAYYFDHVAEPDPARWIAVFREEFPGATPPNSLTLNELARQPWASAWHAHFAPEPVGRRFLLCPPWDVPAEEYALQGRQVIVIEPGQGFGTGRHASTRLILEMLEQEWDAGKCAPPARIVDIGTGSGILAIAARLLGVPKAIVADIDGVVMPEVARNFRHNGLPVPARIQGGAESLRGEHPLVVANLIMPLLAWIAPELSALLAPGGVMIVSGVLETERDALLTAYAAHGLQPSAELRQDGWLACRFERSA